MFAMVLARLEPAGGTGGQMLIGMPGWDVSTAMPMREACRCISLGPSAAGTQMVVHSMETRPAPMGLVERRRAQGLQTMTQKVGSSCSTADSSSRGSQDTT